MKKFFITALSILIVLSLAFSASAAGIMYVITPSTSNPFFGTEQRVGAAKVKALGYEAKCFSHDDDAAKQLELFEAAITPYRELRNRTPVQTLQLRQFAKPMTQKFPYS